MLFVELSILPCYSTRRFEFREIKSVSLGLRRSHFWLYLRLLNPTSYPFQKKQTLTSSPIITTRQNTILLVKMSTIHEKNLISGLSNIFGSSKYSDLTVCCGSDVYKVHRAVICPRSDFFAAACDSGFKVHTGHSISQGNH